MYCWDTSQLLYQQYLLKNIWVYGNIFFNKYPYLDVALVGWRRLACKKTAEIRRRRDAPNFRASSLWVNWTIHLNESTANAVMPSIMNYLLCFSSKVLQFSRHFICYCNVGTHYYKDNLMYETSLNVNWMSITF